MHQYQTIRSILMQGALSESTHWPLRSWVKNAQFFLLRLYLLRLIVPSAPFIAPFIVPFTPCIVPASDKLLPLIRDRALCLVGLFARFLPNSHKMKAFLILPPARIG